MTVTAAQISEVRRKTAEPTATTYSDSILTDYIGRYPLADELGTEPYTWTGTGADAEKSYDTAWIPTYDLNAAAADIWDEKAAAVAANYDFSADGGNYQRSQQYEMCQKMAKHYRARMSMRTIRQIKSPEEANSLSGFSTVNYLNERR